MAAPAAFVFPDNLAALVTARELGHAGVEVVVLSPRKGPAAHSRYASFIEAPDFYLDTEWWAEFIVQAAAARGERPVLFPTEDAALLVVDRHADALSKACRLPYPASGVVPRVLDKLSLYKTAESLGVGVPRFREAGSVAEISELAAGAEEWLAKPSCRYRIDEGGGVKTFLAISGGAKALAGDIRATAATVIGAGFRCIVQERIAGPFEELVSVGLLLAPGGELVASYTARKRCEYPEPFGDGLLVETIEDPGITETAARLMREMGYWGICDVEFKRDPRDGRFKLLDANPRVWLWHDLGAFAGGAPLALGAYEAVANGSEREGRATSVSTAPAVPGPIWVSPRGAAAFMVSAYRPSKHGLTLPIRLTLGALRTMLRNSRAFHDPLYLRPSAWRDLSGAAWRRAKGLLVAGSGGADGRAENH